MEYKRITRPKIEIEYNDHIYQRLQELEDEIEIGSVCRFSDLHSVVYDEVKKNFQSNIKHGMDKYFVDCEDKVKKQIAIEIIDEFVKQGIISEYFVEYLRKEYGTNKGE